MTEKVSLESINKKIDEVLNNQELIMRYLKITSGGKLKGKELEKEVERLTEEGYSIAQISKLADCSPGAVSNYRRLIKDKKAD